MYMRLKAINRRFESVFCSCMKNMKIALMKARSIILNIVKSFGFCLRRRRANGFSSAFMSYFFVMARVW
ncbi:MAG: hypothetical protein DRN71_03125 [Candidatus Nanohalarchaeota archaeon]|nr:MAG: hypothetical protein DRN71_03125 [Candidatus Nanohaloarchaeota archaeon]